MNASPRPIARNCRIITSAGNLRALVDVQVGPLLVRGCRVIQQPDQKPYASLPQQQGKDGRWWPVIQCSDSELEQAIKAEVLDFWREEVGAL